MSSSGSRGPPLNRFGDRSDYDYSKQRRKPFYNGPRRGGPGSSSLSNSKMGTRSGEGAPASEGGFGGNRWSRYGSSSSSTYPIGRYESLNKDNKGPYSNKGPHKNTYYSSGPGTHYPSYGNYNSFGTKPDYSQSGSTGYFGSRGGSWRSERGRSLGDIRPSSSSSSAPAYNQRSSNGSAGDYRKEKYDLYHDPMGRKPFGPMNKAPYSSNNSRGYAPKDRPKNMLSSSGIPGRRSNFYGGRYYSNTMHSGYGSYDKPKGFYQGDDYKTRGGDRPDSRDRYNERTDYRDEDDYDEHSERYSSRDYVADDRSEAPSREETPLGDENANGYYRHPESGGSETPFSNSSTGSPLHVSKERAKLGTEDAVDNDKLDPNELNSFKSYENTEDEISFTNNSNYEQYKNIEDKEEETTSEVLYQDEGKDVKEPDNEATIDNSNKIVDQAQPMDNVTSPIVSAKVEDEPNKKVVEELLKEGDESQEIVYLEGCMYPKTEIETSYEILSAEFAEHVKENGHLKYTTDSPITELNQYPFYIEVIKDFFNNKKKILGCFQSKRTSLLKKKLSLWQQYKQMFQEYEKKRSYMDEQLKIIHPPDDELKKELTFANVAKIEVDKPEPNHADEIASLPNSSNRRSRRHGDLVTTEAEFQEILKSLGKEQEEDPIYRAKKVAATVPDFKIDVLERKFMKFYDSNNLITNKNEWGDRYKYDFVDNFSEEEHNLYCEGFCLYPKRFGAISKHMGGLRTQEDCVVHYYCTKRIVNYKQLLQNFKKKSGRKQVKRKASRSRNVSQVSTPVSTPATEHALEHFSGSPTSGAEDISMNGYFTDEIADATKGKKNPKPDRPEAVKRKLETADLPSSPVQKKKSKKTKKDEAKNPEANSETTSTDLTPSSAPAALDLESGVTGSKTDVPISEITEAEGKRRKAITSYWSITESNMFPELLKEYGTKWTSIADRLTTKSATMVRNYFIRNSEKYGWNKIAEEADARLKEKFDAIMSTTSESILNVRSSQTERPPVSVSSGHDTVLKLVQVEQAPKEHATFNPTIDALINKTESIETEKKPEPAPVVQTVKQETNAPVSVLQPPFSERPARTSIMSLLNSDAPTPTSTNTSNSIRSLLNDQPSTTSKEKSQQSTGLNALLSVMNSDTTVDGSGKVNE